MNAALNIFVHEAFPFFWDEFLGGNLLKWREWNKG